MEEKIRTLGVLNARHFSAALDEVRLRTGKITERIRIEHPEAAAVIPFIDREHILMVRQWRYAVGRETLEIPAGKVDPGEDPEACAYRELAEETGFQASRLLPVCAFHPAIGYSGEVIRIYAAFGLTPSPIALDVDEIAKVETVKFKEAFDLVSGSEILDGKTVIGLTLVRNLLLDGGIPGHFFD